MAKYSETRWGYDQQIWSELFPIVDAYGFQAILSVLNQKQEEFQNRQIEAKAEFTGAEALKTDTVPAQR
jgi:hypothetical protein